MIRKFKPKSEFSRNVLILMSGTTISQAIAIAISPILTRIYTPEDFGVFALFIAIISIFGSIANGRYELAIMLPKKDEDAMSIFALGFVITSFISFMLLILVVLFNDYFTKLLNNDIGVWLYFVPISVFFIGIYNILNYFNNRKKYYKDIANATILRSVVVAIIQISLGLVKSGVTGLIVGQLLSQIVANTRLLKNIIKNKLLLRSIKVSRVIAMAKRYKKFPKFSMWAGLLNTLNSHVPILILSFYGFFNQAGFYILVQKLLSIPSSVISSNLNQVLYKDLVEGRINNTLSKKLTYFLFLMINISIAPAILIMFFLPSYVSDIFGGNWNSEVGTMIVIMTPLFVFQFIFSSMSYIISIMEWQKYGLIYHFLSFLISIFSIVLGINSSGVIYGLLLYSILQSVFILSYRGIMLKFLNINVFKLISLIVFNILLYGFLGYIATLFLLANSYMVIAIFLIYILAYILIFKYSKRLTSKE